MKRGNQMTCPGGVQISAYLRRQGVSVPTPCGGRGNCGKCIIRLIQGELPVSAMDRVHLSEEMLSSGYRLACQAMPQTDVVIEFDMQIP